MDKTAVFIMPRPSTAWKGSEALWITAAGWATAGAEYFGKAVVQTTDGENDPQEVWSFPRNTTMNASLSGKSRYLPEPVITLLKDLRLYQAFKQFLSSEIPRHDSSVELVWEQHDLFTGYGRRLADYYGAPLFTYVHAPVVWEARKWGVKRRLTGGFLTKLEARNLKKSDLILCVSNEVRDELIRMGIEANKVLVSPMSVDVDRFNFTPAEIRAKRKELGIENNTVIGWTGSFRGFHGLQDLVRAFSILSKSNPETRLLLVGDGKLRAELENLSEELGIKDKVIFMGRISFPDIPLYVGCFDLAILSADRNTEFHYSPLKLREYLAAGIPSIAPNVGEIPDKFMDNEHLLLYNLDEKNDLLNKCTQLLTNTSFAQQLGAQGKSYISEHGTWKSELSKALAYFHSMEKTMDVN